MLKSIAAWIALAGTTSALAATPAGDHWVATWATAQNLVRVTPPPATAAAAARGPGRGNPFAQGFHDQTVRMIVRTSLGGKKVRIRLANQYGGQPVNIGAAHLARAGADGAILPDTDLPLTFSGKPACTLGPGMVFESDPVDLNLAPQSDLAVSLYFKGETGPPTAHGTGLHTTYISKDGDATAQASIVDAAATLSYYYLAGIDVLAPADAFTIVTFGDSITDGTRSDPNTNHSWPALLAARLAAKKETAQIGVANVGISGNRVLRDGAGASALARFDRDVLGQPGVKWLAILEGINDIGRNATTPEETTNAEEIIGIYKQMIGMAHSHGILVIGCTLTPFEAAGYYRETSEPIREAVNQWIRTSHEFDAAVDFEAAVRASDDPKKMRAEFDPGDHLHLNNAGYEAMAAAFDLNVFTKKRK